ncbi:hypothetical protein PFISCL1PPCAC_7709, partial [Pristionchus fissidentatus]
QITHISSLNDIVPLGIVDETEKGYKVKIGCITKEFLEELEHPEFGKDITKLFEIVREGDDMFVWASSLQVRYILPTIVAKWEKEKLIESTTEKIKKMTLINYKPYP